MVALAQERMDAWNSHRKDGTDCAQGDCPRAGAWLCVSCIFVADFIPILAPAENLSRASTIRSSEALNSLEA